MELGPHLHERSLLRPRPLPLHLPRHPHPQPRQPPILVWTGEVKDHAGMK